MSAVILREAATLMRARAKAVGEGPWQSYALPDAGPNRWTMTGVGVVGDDTGHRAEAMFPADAEHIASWHPAVALAVAAWLDMAADHMDSELDGGCPDCERDGALTVARTYLGRADA